MAHIFKPGDRAYWVANKTWITLEEGDPKYAALYPLKDIESPATFKQDGRQDTRRDIVLFPLNPYDPADPNNPQDFRNPFVHEGRIVKYGDQLLDKRTGKIVGKVSYLVVDHNGASMRIFNDGVTHAISIGNPDFTFDDSYKKKVMVRTNEIPKMGWWGGRRLSLFLSRMPRAPHHSHKGANSVGSFRRDGLFDVYSEPFSPHARS